MTFASSVLRLPLPGIFRGDAVAQLDALARGNPQEVGGAPDDVVLELVALAVRKYDLDTGGKFQWWTGFVGLR